MKPLILFISFILFITSCSINRFHMEKNDEGHYIGENNYINSSSSTEPLLISLLFIHRVKKTDKDMDSSYSIDLKFTSLSFDRRLGFIDTLIFTVDNGKEISPSFIRYNAETEVEGNDTYYEEFAKFEMEEPSYDIIKNAKQIDIIVKGLDRTLVIKNDDLNSSFISNLKNFYEYSHAP